MSLQRMANASKEGPAVRPLTVFLIAFAAFFAAIAAWSVATPLMASPDEPVQVAKAAAVVRGELVGRLVGGPSSPTGIVTIPNAYANLGALVRCYQFQADVPASCAPAYHASPGNVTVPIYDARYPPLYYLAVGLPSLLTDSAMGIYLMRLVSDALNALFLALAVMAAVTWCRSRLLLAGVIVAATPSVLFFAGVVNPSGFETSVAICLWTSAVVLARERLRNPPTGLVALVAASAGVEALTRPLSPFWVVLTFFAVLAVADWGGLADFARSRAALLGGAFATACGVLASAWILVVHALNVSPPSAPVLASVGEGHLLTLAFLRTPVYFTEMVSRFGWLVAPSPSATYVIWAGLLGVLGVLALASGAIRRCVTLVVLVAAVVVVPMLISTGQAHRLGITWQGKDTLPLAVGVPVLAASMVANSGLRSVRVFRARFVGVVAAAAGLATVVALFGNVRRDAVGDDGPSLAFLHATWQPPLGIVGVLVFGVAATVTLMAVLALLGMPPKEARSRSTPSSLPPGAGSPLELAAVVRDRPARPAGEHDVAGGNDAAGDPGQSGERVDACQPDGTGQSWQPVEVGETERPGEAGEGGDRG